MTLLAVENLAVRQGGRVILDGVSFSVRENRWLMVAGPNGAGKSTLVRSVAQGIPYRGRVLFRGEDAARMKPARLARKIGVLSQSHVVAYPYTVEEIVRLGRYAHARGFWARAGPGDDEKVHSALSLTGLLAQRGQSALTLSGGELQRVFLAQVLAQDPDLLLLDEPAGSLDLAYQRQVFDLVREWTRRPGRGAVSVVHDLSLARAYGTDFLLLDQGRVAAVGGAEEVFGPGPLERVYGMDVHGWMENMLGQWKK